ncbi:10646_t:CDS:10 [Ambispora leptoticha]|uniref:10646_t:CDS:1 n=1 Tax=Ambispora leptoticha TaxID=144679 RepID=A0A9N8Z6M2_9GLOM|nr:10646_t:CDS:10 [Ambispora leptoticha]
MITDTFPKKNHNCGALRKCHVGERVVLCGWAQKLRKFSTELIFLPIRDSYGTTQLVYNAAKSKNSVNSNEDDDGLLEKLTGLPVESIICVEGIVVERSKENYNEHMPTGEIEVQIDKLYCLNPAKPLPFYPTDKKLINEEVRLRNRCIDLRRDIMQKNLRTRSRVSSIIHNFLDNEGFVEVETPLLFKSTPEGAREFIVPTRTIGSFYALPQSPQQYKQLLIAGGIDKYYQIAKCFRDEDLRADRQPEFTQIDLEMSFVTAADVTSLIERLMVRIWKDIVGIELIPNKSFPRISYQDAMRRFGTDKPDTRYELEISDISNYLSDILDQSKSKVECLVIKKGGTFTGAEIKSIEQLANQSLNQGKKPDSSLLNFVKIKENNINTWISKANVIRQSTNATSMQEEITKELNVEIGDLVVVSKSDARLSGVNWTTIGRIRTNAANLLRSKGLIQFKPSLSNFLWVEQFPLFTRDQDTGLLTSTHHPFTSPEPGDINLLFDNPELVRGQHYDLVLDGVEIGGGSIRVHSFELQQDILENILKIKDIKQAGFQHLIDALGSGCPPHGGIALGFDRLMSVILRTESIRDVIAFPKNGTGNDLCVGSPSFISKERIRLDYGIQLLSSSFDENQ